jgi:predicted nucleic acid-binding protein
MQEGYLIDTNVISELRSADSSAIEICHPALNCHAKLEALIE